MKWEKDMTHEKTGPGRLPAVVLAAVLAGACGVPAPPDTPELRQEKAVDVARLEVEKGGLDEALDTGADFALATSLDTLAAQLGREPTDAEANRVRAILRSALAEVLTAERWQQASAAVYARHLAPAELEAIAAFYRSPTGTRLLGLQSEISNDLGDAAEEILGQGEDEFARLVDAALANEFPDLKQETEE
jgi:hypothetical protein